MVAGDTTIQQVLEAVAEQVATVPGLKGAYANDRSKLGQTPCVVFSFFSPLPTALTHGSTQLWIANATATLYGGPIKGNPQVQVDIEEYQQLIHPIVDIISQHPQKYPYGSKMAALTGVDRIAVTSIRPAQFGLVYAGHSYYGAEMNVEIKLHRRISY